MYSITIEIPSLPLMPNQLLGAHWRKRSTHATVWRNAIWAKIAQHKPSTPLERAHLTLTRGSSTEPDFDGLVGSFKAVIDALVYCRILVNDKQENIGTSTYIWSKCPQKKGFVRIKIEELE
jgi:hypothetical protein